MKSVLSHMELSIKNKQCFMCKHFKGDSSIKGNAISAYESCKVTNRQEPFDWFDYYRHDKHPPMTLSYCNGKDFVQGGKYYRVYKTLKNDYE
jgi:hypothetical protein